MTSSTRVQSMARERRDRQTKREGERQRERWKRERCGRETDRERERQGEGETGRDRERIDRERERGGEREREWERGKRLFFFPVTSGTTVGGSGHPPPLLYLSLSLSWPQTTQFHLPRVCRCMSMCKCVHKNGKREEKADYGAKELIFSF